MPTREGVRTLDVVLTAGCNLRCTYCYQNAKTARRMDWKTLRAAVDLLLSSRRPEVRLMFLGGEPLLEFPLVRQAVAYAEQVRPPGLAVHYDIITNGTLLREEELGFLVAHDFQVQLSFDGVPAAQDLRGRGTFAQLDLLLDRLRREHPAFFSNNLRIGMTLLASTVPHLAESVRYFLDKEVEHIAIAPAATHQDWPAHRIDELDEQFALIFEACVRHYRRHGRVPLALFHPDEDESPHKPEGPSMCGVGRGENLAVDVDGEVHGCVMFAESYQVFPTAFLRTRLEAMRMGRVDDAAFPARLGAYPAAARAAELFHGKREKYSTYGACRDCRYLESCGVCPVSIGHQPGNEDPRRIPDFLCAWNLVSQKYRERFPKRLDAYAVLTGGAAVPPYLRELEAFAAAAGARRA